MGGEWKGRWEGRKRGMREKREALKKRGKGVSRKDEGIIRQAEAEEECTVRAREESKGVLDLFGDSKRTKWWNMDSYAALQTMKCKAGYRL